jgi:hypothetical protein
MTPLKLAAVFSGSQKNPAALEGLGKQDRIPFFDQSLFDSIAFYHHHIHHHLPG